MVPIATTHSNQVLVRGSVMHSNMSKVECDVLMHLLHRQCVLRFSFISVSFQFHAASPFPTPFRFRYTVDAAYGQVPHAFRYNTKPVISVATHRPPYAACCS